MAKNSTMLLVPSSNGPSLNTTSPVFVCTPWYSATPEAVSQAPSAERLVSMGLPLLSSCRLVNLVSKICLAMKFLLEPRNACSAASFEIKDLYLAFGKPEICRLHSFQVSNTPVFRPAQTA